MSNRIYRLIFGTTLLIALYFDQHAVIYGLIAVRSPAPPIIAVLGLLGMLAGEAAVQWLRGHGDAVAHALHLKSFSVAQNDRAAEDTNPT